MKNTDDMNVKIQNSGKNGVTNTKGSCRKLATYLEHEDDERHELGKEVYPFVKADGTPVSKEEVIDKIDRNHMRLSRLDDKFYHIVVSPSRKEVAAMGANEQEVHESGLRLINYISDAYAEGFHKEGVEDGDDLVIFWKIHFTRGDNDELQFHIHGIVSRRAKSNGPKLSPMTNHRNTLSGPVTGGFDRQAFAERCEQIFDEYIKYDRKVAETYEYNNAMAHGTAAEKAAQADRLAQEEAAELKKDLTDAFEKRKKRKKAKSEVDELAALLEKKVFSFPTQRNSMVEDAMKMAEIVNDLMASISRSADKTSLELNLACLGLSIKPIVGENGGVTDFTITHKGRQVSASTLLDKSQMSTLLSHWEQFTGQTSEQAIREQRQQKEKEAAERKLKLAFEQGRERNRNRGMRMKR